MKTQIEQELSRYKASHNWAWRPDLTTRKALHDGNLKTKRFEMPPKRIEEMQMFLNTVAASSSTPRRVSKKPAKGVPTKVVKKVSAKTAAPKAEVDSGIIPLKALCRELGVDPRLARRKLRRASISGHDPRNRWSFKKDSAVLSKAREVLSTKAE